MPVRRLTFVALPLALILVACGGHAKQATLPTVEPSIAPTATPLPLPTATPIPQGDLQPDGQRILAHVKKLADDIGSRSSGTPAELLAVDYISGQLRGFGYDVSTQEFPALSEASREAKLTVNSPSQRSVAALPFAQSGGGEAQGRLVAAGLGGSAADFPAAVAGNIALIERGGEVLFQTKVANAVAAGAKGAVIFNNDSGNFLGSLTATAPIPVVSISQSDGQALVQQLKSGPIDADVLVGGFGNAAKGHNVIAKPPGKDCETITAGHLDSVTVGPGANDNGSGTATVIEVAGVMARAGRMDNNCFILFGGEELGLLGSRAYLANLPAADKQRLKFMLDLDMVGYGDQSWYLIGDGRLQNAALQFTPALSMNAIKATLASTGGTSDNETFTNAGIPALFIYRADDPQWHRPGDVAGRVRPDLMEQAARLTIELLKAPGTSGG